MPPELSAPFETLAPGQESRAALAAPSPVYLTGEENIRLTALSNTASVTLTVNGRILRPDSTPSPLNESLKPTSNRVVATAIFGLSEGWLLGLTIRATAGSPPAGSTWVCLDLVRGSGSAAQVVQTLGYGFVTANKPYAWPISANTDPLDGVGHLRSVTGTQPAAGAEISEAVPVGAQWELLAFEAELVTSAAAANRVPQFTFDDGTNVYARSGVNNNEPASGTWRHSLQAAASLIFDATRGVVTLPFPEGLRLGAGHRIKTVTASIQAGDQWLAPQLLIRERFPLE